jgi:acetyl-CoA C-acetyltransferase
MGTAFILDAVRTPRGRGKMEKGALSSVHPQELFAQTMGELASRTAFDKKDVDDVVVGTVSQAGEQGGCIARMAVLAAGYPHGTTGVSLNRFCGSGQQALMFAAMGVASGAQDLVIGGGVESMSRVPMGSDKAGLDGHNRHLRELYPLVPQGVSADLVASREGFSRHTVDQFALRSQQNAARAMKEGRFDKGMFAVKSLEGQVLLSKDELPRADASLEGLAKLEAAFAQIGQYVQKGDTESFVQKALRTYRDVGAIDHVHTAGNSSGIVDGAAALLVASEDYIKAHGLKPRAKVVSMATAGDEPVIMLTAPTPASKKALDKAGMSVRDIDLWEINEAFAAVPLKVIKDFGIDPERVNVNGGAIALGHPLGATGAMLIGTVLDELERQDKHTALITMCIGGGMATATIIQRV